MRPFSLKARMSFTVMALVLVILAGVGGLALHYFEQSFRTLIADQQSTLVGQIAARIDGQLTKTSELITATADSFPLELLTAADHAQAYLDRQLGLGTTSLFDNGIFLFTADGHMLAEYPFKPGRRGRDYSFRKYFQDTITSGQAQISDPYTSSQKHKHPAVNFTAPIRDSAGQIAAVIVGSVDLTQNNFLGGLSEIRVGQTGYLYLYNTDRLMIMHRDPARIMQQDVPVGANIWFDRALEGFEGTAETVNSRGLRALATFKRLNSDRWILASNYPTAEAFQPVIEGRRFFLFGIGITLLISIAVTWFMTRVLLAPLSRLNDHVAGFSKAGAESNRIDKDQGHEVDRLAATFDGLMAELSDQRRAAEDRLAFLQGVIDTIPHPTFFKDLDGRFLGCNQAMQTLCGKHLDEIIGTTIHDQLPSGMAQRLVEGDEILLQGVSGFLKQEIDTTRNQDESSCALVYKALLKDGQGDAQGIVSSLVDISELKAVEMALAREREFTLNLLQNSATPCFVIDLNHRVLIWTLALEQLTGLKAIDVLDSDLQWRAFYPEKRPCLADIVLDKDFNDAIELYPLLGDSPLIPNGIQSEGWRTLYNGKSKYLSFDAAPIHDRDGKLVAVIQTLHDLTNLKHTEEALRESQESYHALVDNSPDAILVHRQNQVLYGNRAAALLFQTHDKQELAGMSLSDLLHPDCHAITFKKIAEIETKQSTKTHIEERIVCFNGETLSTEVGLSPTYYAGDWAVQSVLRDITLRKAEQDRVWRQANFDLLTGLPNRSLFMDRLVQAISRADREAHLAGLLFVDLDHFKAVNDSLGHDNGDELLRQVAVRMTGCLRQSETVARLGGDEFTIILPVVTDIMEMQSVANRLLKALVEPFELPGGTRQISCSIGGALYPRDAKTVTDLLCVADTSMYLAKQAGRDGFVFAESK